MSASMGILHCMKESHSELAPRAIETRQVTLRLHLLKSDINFEAWDFKQQELVSPVVI